VGAQRSGCVGGASLEIADPAFEQVALCRNLDARDAVPCLHGVEVQSTEGKPTVQRRLLGECERFPADARADCARWFGLTLNLVTNGGFARVCATLAPVERAPCAAGARAYTGPIVTFS
jgi:hypothetical protein